MTSAERLRDLAKDLPFDRPDATRVDAVRTSLLDEVNASTSPTSSSPSARRRYLFLGAAFTAGAVAAAAVALLVIRPRDTDRSAALAHHVPAQITASTEARIEHHVVATTSGVDEIVQVHDGTVRLAVANQRTGDHVRLRTRDAEVEGAGEYLVEVSGESLAKVAVRSGTARIIVVGRAPVFLAAGQTWHASVITTDLGPTPSPAHAEPTQPGDVVADVDPANDGTHADSLQPAPSSLDKARDVSPSIAATSRDVRPSTGATSRDVPRTSRDVATDVRRSSSTTSSTRHDVATDVRRSSSTTSSTPRDARSTTVGGTTTNPTVGATTTNASRDIRPTPSTATNTATASQDVRPPTPSTTAPSAPSKKPVSEIEQRFQTGWKLLKAGRAKEAAIELGRAADAAPDDALAADARYLQAVALVRAGDRAQAERVLVAFLDRAPHSLRRGRAAVLLGRLFGERGDTRTARAWLESALHDQDPAVAAAARAGLDELDRKK